MSKHMKFKCEVKTKKFSENAHKLKKIGYSSIIPFVYVDKEKIHK